jgi:hypothetical protein
MTEKEPTQRTGHEIPVPKRTRWDRVLRKAAQPRDDQRRGHEPLPDDPKPVT